TSLMTSLGAEPLNDYTPAIAAACVPAAITNANNTQNAGPHNVSLGTLNHTGSGYTQEGNRFYLDHTYGTCASSQAIARIYANESSILTVTTRNRENVRAWIDYNN